MRGTRNPRLQRRARPRGAAMSVETITLGCRLNFAESETIARSAPRGRGLDRRQQLRRDQRSRPPDAPGDPPRASASGPTRRSSSRAALPSSSRAPSRPCRASRASSEMRASSTAWRQMTSWRQPGFHGPRPKLRRGPDGLRPSLHLLLDLAGARAKPIAALRSDPRCRRARDRPRREGDRPHRRRHHRL